MTERGHDVEVDMFGDPAVPLPESPKDVFESYEPPKAHLSYDAPRCPWDGSAMPYVITTGWFGFDDPYPIYTFECEICGWEDEIS